MYNKSVVVVCYRCVKFKYYFDCKYFITSFVNFSVYTAVITGATEGIGKAYARELARDGLNVVLISRSESKLKDVATGIGKKPAFSNLILIGSLFINCILPNPIHSHRKRLQRAHQNHCRRFYTKRAHI